MLTFNEQNKRDTLQKEWLITNGLGGYASSTISGANTRKYHGLLVASNNPPADRQNLVSKVEESIILSNGDHVGLSTNYYPGAMYPQGFAYIEGFSRNPLPEVIISAKGHKLKKTIFMVHESNTTVLEYENLGNKSTELSFNPLLTYKKHHHLYRQNEDFCRYVGVEDRTLTIYLCNTYDTLFIKYSGGEYYQNFDWYRNFEYPEDMHRGEDCHEDAFSIGTINVKLNPREKFWLTFSTDSEAISKEPGKLKQQELLRLARIAPKGIRDKFLKDLFIAADQFVVQRLSTKNYSIIAGYHWFTDWSRDTMIALRGIGIEAGREDLCRSVLQTFLSYMDQGMLPNRFPDSKDDQPEYNTMDGTLWLFIVLYEFYKKFEDAAFIQANFYHLESILKAHIEGTRYQIRVTEEGFLFGGEGNVQLTWMDARVGDHVVTPRHGGPVEIQALWYNALKIFLFFSGKIQGISSSLKPVVKEIADKIKANFKTYYLNEEGYLNDVILRDYSADASVRPNQIYIFSLPFPLLDKTDGKSVMNVVEKHLFKLHGLRTLSPEDPAFRRLYEGNHWDRDTAYHQGTIWPYLLADYFSACMFVYDDGSSVKRKLQNCLETLKHHFYQSNCIHGVSEIFDGLLPDEGKGAVQQAWSVNALICMLYMGNNTK